MPCFQGLAVSIHTPDGPIPEHSIQRQQKFGRITSYIPVPAPQFGDDGNPQPSTFAVSITLLTPGLRVPYSAPKPTMNNPYPQPAIVGGLPGTSSLRGQYHSAVKPYVPHTNSPNETVAAYIYFDGRQKEEVATLLRRGEETWVNSRWVSIPDSEGGGIAEREFLFREVGLERWLNGLDLSAGADKARKIKRRQRKLEKTQRIKKEQMDSDDEDMAERKPKLDRDGVLRYGGDANAPVQPVIDDDDLSEDSSDDEPPELEASGQIKVALFRVLASGEIKRGEYSPQFDVHDDEGVDGQGNIDGGEDVDHTTSFAKPKSLDPKSISTQTVTGLDPPDAPFAVFTFFYRGEKQLQKMGILDSPVVKVATPSVPKRKSVQTDFSKLGPLKNTGTKGFSSYRDKNASRKPGTKDDDAMDSDDDDGDNDHLRDQMDDNDDKPDDPKDAVLDPEESRRQEEVAQGMSRIKLKRHHSSDAANLANLHPSKSPGAPKSGLANYVSADSPSGGTNTPNSATATAGTPNEKPNLADLLSVEAAGDALASPFKKQRSSIQGLEGSLRAGESASGVSENADVLGENGREIPGAIFAGVTANGASTTPNASFNPFGGFGSGEQSMSETNRQNLASATALPDEDEEL